MAIMIADVLPSTLVWMLLVAAPSCVGSAVAPSLAKNEAAQTRIQQDTYDLLEHGMTYENACIAVGGPGDEWRTSMYGARTSVAYCWTNEDGSNAIVTFLDGRLVAKTQSGLKPSVHGNAYAAWVAAKLFAMQYLGAPEDAHWFEFDPATTHPSGDDTFHTEGWFETTSSDGTKTRTEFTCTVRWMKGEFVLERLETPLR
jgi:hypothetical protein